MIHFNASSTTCQEKNETKVLLQSEGQFSRMVDMENTQMDTNTRWERIETSEGMLRFLRGTHSLFSRLADGEHIFTILPVGQTPGEHDGGYRSIYAALKTKGLR